MKVFTTSDSILDVGIYIVKGEMWKDKITFATQILTNDSKPAICLYLTVHVRVPFEQLLYHVSHRKTKNTHTGLGFKQTR